MIEFTILLDDSELEFEPTRSEPDLAFALPPTARIGRDDDVLHLAPIPVHCFFNAMTFGHWVASEHSLSENDAFCVYAIHDMFKGLLHQVPRWDGQRRWIHQREFFDPLASSLKVERVFDDFAQSFRVAKFHGMADERQIKVEWQEAVEYERAIEAGTEIYWKKRGRKTITNWPMIGLTIRLQSALSNALSIAYVKRLFVESYVEVMRAEYPDVFARFDAVSYEYEFVDPTTLTGDTDRDIKTLCRQSKVDMDGRWLVIHTFIGAYGPHWKSDQKTTVRLPFWLLLTLHEDPVSILFPVPTLHGSDGNPADNPAFVDRVRDGFHRRVHDLLTSTKVSTAKRTKWNARVDEIMVGIDETFHIVHTTAFDDATNARRVDSALATETCSMCGSPVPASFACSPVADLGASVSNYTDWHLGDADRACVLCAISHFKTPDALEPARKLIFQRKVVYFATSTPSARESSKAPATLPFFTATGFKPKLEIRSLESLVTLNVVAALYLHDVLERAVHNGKRNLWLNLAFPTGAFSFVGEIQTEKTKSRIPEIPSFLSEFLSRLNRPITLLDPLLPIQVEVPFQALVCLFGTSKGRHYEFKYKPLIVSSETGTLPVVWEGYHLVDAETIQALAELERLLSKTRSANEDANNMRIPALLSDPNEFLGILVEPGGFNYETLIERLRGLSGGTSVQGYLAALQSKLYQHPLAVELWTYKKRKRRGKK
jgi:hypothetical protein